MSQLEQIIRAEKINKRGFSTPIERIRLMLGLVMMFAGLYIGFFFGGPGEGLGLVSFMASPFVMIADG